MKKNLLLIVFVALSSIVMAQEKDKVIWDICGAKFGDSYETTKAAVQKYMERIQNNMREETVEKLGDFAINMPLSRHSDVPKPMEILGSIRYMRYGRSANYFKLYDVVFDYITFHFTSGDDTPHLRSVMFEIECNSKKEAKNKYKDVVEILKKHFTLYSGTDEDGKEIYGGGSYYKYDDKCAFLVDLGEDKKTIYLSFREGGF